MIFNFSINNCSFFYLVFFQFIPCFVREQLVSSINELKRQVMEEEGSEDDLVFQTREELEYRMDVTHKLLRTRIHGSGWSKLVTDYDLGYGDLITIDLCSDSLKIDIDLKLSESRGGHRPFLKASYGKCSPAYNLFCSDIYQYLLSDI